VGLADLPVVIDSRLRLPPGLPRQLVSALKKECSHANPDFHKRRAMGYATFGLESAINTWELHDRGTPAESLSLPRGAMDRLREIARDHGYYARALDRRVRKPAVEWPALRFKPRWYQDEAVEACMRKEQGIVRAPTGSGKTIAALTFAREAAQPTLVIMRDSQLLEQWIDVAVEMGGLHPREIGVLKGGRKLRIGARLTLALQQTIYSKSFPLDEVASAFGNVMIDEVQDVAAVTFQRVIHAFDARYRIGWSADETRKDKKEFLIYDAFGRPVYEIERDILEDEGAITPVDVVCVPTTFSADWYRDAQAGERDWNGLLDRITTDDDRNTLLVRLVQHLNANAEVPALVFSHRVEHARSIADEMLFAARVRCGLLLGGPENAQRYKEDKARLKGGDLPVCAGTFTAVGRGIDMPAVLSGVMATPIGSNRQFFGQVRGRCCRKSAGKERGTLYVLWDREVFPYMPGTLEKWNGGNVRVAEIEELLSTA
jgi:superfamily II DNA or RNA helicase